MKPPLEKLNRVREEAIQFEEQREINARMSLLPVLGIFNSYLGMISRKIDDPELSTLLFENSAQELLGWKESEKLLGFGVKQETVVINLDQLAHDQAVRLISLGLQKASTQNISLIEIGKLEEDLLKQIEELQTPPAKDALPEFVEAWHDLKTDLQEKIKKAEQGLSKTQVFPVLYSNNGTSQDSGRDKEMVQSLNAEGINMPVIEPTQPFNITNIDWSDFLTKLPVVRNTRLTRIYSHDLKWEYPFGTDEMTILRYLWMFTSLDLTKQFYHNIIDPDWDYKGKNTNFDLILKKKWKAFEKKFKYGRLIDDTNIEEWSEEHRMVYLISSIVQYLGLGKGVPYNNLEKFIQSVGVSGTELTLEGLYQTRFMPRLKNTTNEQGSYPRLDNINVIAQEIIQEYKLDDSFLETILELLANIDGKSEIFALTNLYKKTNDYLLKAKIIDKGRKELANIEIESFLADMDGILPSLEIFMKANQASVESMQGSPIVEVDQLEDALTLNMGGQEVSAVANYQWLEETILNLPSSIQFPEEESISVPVKCNVQVINSPNLQVNPTFPKKDKVSLITRMIASFAGKKTAEAKIKPLTRWEVVIQEALEKAFPEAKFCATPELRQANNI